MISNPLTPLACKVRRWNHLRQWNQALRKLGEGWRKHELARYSIKLVVVMLWTITAINVAVALFLVLTLP